MVYQPINIFRFDLNSFQITPLVNISIFSISVVTGVEVQYSFLRVSHENNDTWLQNVHFEI